MVDHKKNFVSGVSWSFLGNFTTQIVSILITIVLARILTPNEFGIIGMVTVSTGFARTLIDFGLGNALIYQDDATETDRSTVFWTNLTISLILSGLFILLAGSIASFYNEEKLRQVTIVISLVLVINSFPIVNSSILRKRLDFKTDFKISLMATIISGSVGVLMAIGGYGYWALISQVVTESVVSALLSFYFVRWFPKAQFSKHSLIHLLKFSWGLVGNNSINYWVRNIDNLLIGKYIGTSALGIYSKAYSLLTLPMRNISNVVSKVLFPSLLQFKQNPEKIRAIYFKVCQTIILIVAPLMTFLFVEADILVELVFGAKWLAMVPVVKVFCILSINQSIGTLITNVYMAHGKTKEMFVLGTFLRIMLISAIVVGLQWGILGVAICYTVAGYLSSSINHAYVGKIAGFTLADFTKNVAPVVILNIFIGGIVFLVHFLLQGFLGNFIMLITSMLIYGGLYLGLLTLFKVKSFIELKALVLPYLKRK